MSSLIFVVDDDDAARLSLEAGLCVEGYSVEAFTCAEDLLKRLDHLVPNCIVSDIRLPGMHGDALVRELSGDHGQIPIILVTGHADVSVTMRSIQDGAIGVLNKPYPFDELLKLVGSVVKRARKAS